MIPTWGTVSMTHEPTALLMAFAAHHLQLGASEVHLCLDRPDPAFEALAADKPRIRVWTCDQAFWDRVNGGTRPADSRDRQMLIAGHVYGQTGVDWLAHIDTDEFLVRMPQILRFLASRPDDVAAVTVMNAERVEWRGRAPAHVFGGVFRKPFPREAPERVAAVYGDAAAYLLRGFSGYAFGKSFFRTGAGLRPGIHWPQPPEVWADNPARQIFPRIGLLHFDTWSVAHWRRKLLARVTRQVPANRFNPGRLNQIKAVDARRDDPDGLTALYEATRTVTRGTALRLGLARKLLPLRFDITPALRAEWPGQEIDLTVAAIDRAFEMRE